MVRCHHLSHNSMRLYRQRPWALLPMYDVVRRTVSRCFAAFWLRRYVVKSPTTAFVFSWSRSSTRGSIMATLFAGLPVYLQRRLQFVLNAAAWLVFRLRRYDNVSDAFAILHGCVCQNGSTLKWRLWHTECWTVWRHRIWTNLFLYLACQVVAVCGRRSRCSCASRRTVCQQLAVARLLSQPLFSGTLC